MFSEDALKIYNSPGGDKLRIGVVFRHHGEKSPVFLGRKRFLILIFLQSPGRIRARRGLMIGDSIGPRSTLIPSDHFGIALW